MIGVVDGVDIGSDMHCEVLFVDVYELKDAADEAKTHVVMTKMMSVIATMCSKAGDIVVVSDLPRMQPLKVIVAVRLYPALLFVVGMASSWSSGLDIRYVMVMWRRQRQRQCFCGGGEVEGANKAKKRAARGRERSGRLNFDDVTSLSLHTKVRVLATQLSPIPLTLTLLAFVCLSHSASTPPPKQDNPTIRRHRQSTSTIDIVPYRTA